MRAPTKAQIRASRRNGRKPVKEGSRPRGRPRGPQPWLELGITRQAWHVRRKKEAGK